MGYHKNRITEWLFLQTLLIMSLNKKITAMNIPDKQEKLKISHQLALNFKLEQAIQKNAAAQVMKAITDGAELKYSLITALTLFIKHQNPVDVITLLLRHGADPFEENSSTGSPLRFIEQLPQICQLNDAEKASLKYLKLSFQTYRRFNLWPQLPQDMKLEIIKASIKKIKERKDVTIIGQLASANRECCSLIKSNLAQNLIVEKLNSIVTKKEARPPKKWSRFEKRISTESALAYSFIPWLKSYFEKYGNTLYQIYPYTHLHIASATNALVSAKFLLEKHRDKIKINELNLNQNTPLFIAVCYKSHQVAKFLLDQMTSEEKTKENRATLFKQASEEQDEEMIKILGDYFKTP